MQVEKYNKGVSEASEGFASVSREYKVDSPQLVFDLLCNKLYSNPLPTMIQEYMANARDAHRELDKNSVPIKITIPDTFDPHIYIRDFGPGLTDQRIDDVFTRLGASTKQDSDEMTGGFGLGAKIGWAYGDSFTVISVVDGKESTYLAYMDDAGIGRMDTLSCIDTEEENGVTIKIKIKTGDAHKIKNIVQKISYFWDTKPECNVALLHYNDDAIKNFILHSAPFASDGVFAVVDGIPYEILVSHTPILEQISNSNRKDSAAFLFFDVPEIDVAINREGLRYSNKTIDAINFVIQKVIDENKRQIDFAKRIPNYFDKVAAIKHCYTQLGAPGNTVCALSPFVYLRFSYKKYAGELCVLGSSTEGSRTAIYEVCKNNNILKNVQVKHSEFARNLHGLSANECYPAPSIRELENTMNIPSYVTSNVNAKRYILLTSNAELSEAINKKTDKIRTILAHASAYERKYIIVTDNKVLYDILTKYEQYTDIESITPTYVEKGKGNYGSRDCGFTDRDVKDIRNRLNTLDIDDLIENVHMWCTFRERAKVLKMKEAYDMRCIPEFQDRACFYLTAPQIEYIKYKNIPHYSEVYKQAVTNKKASIFAEFVRIQAKLKDDTYIKASYLETVESRSINRALFDHADKVNKDCSFHDYIYAKAALFLANSSEFESLNQTIANYTNIIQRNYFADASGDSYALHFPKKQYRFAKTIDKWKTMLRLASKKTVADFNEEYPLLGFLQPTFPGAAFRNKEHREVIKHVIQYLNAKK